MPDTEGTSARAKTALGADRPGDELFEAVRNRVAQPLHDRELRGELMTVALFLAAATGAH